LFFYINYNFFTFRKPLFVFSMLIPGATCLIAAFIDVNIYFYSYILIFYYIPVYSNTYLYSYIVIIYISPCTPIYTSIVLYLYFIYSRILQYILLHILIFYYIPVYSNIYFYIYLYFIIFPCTLIYTAIVLYLYFISRFSSLFSRVLQYIHKLLWFSF